MDPSAPQEPGELLREWQRHIVRGLLTTMAVAGFGMFVLFIGTLDLVASIGGVVVLSGLLVCAYWRRVPDSVRIGAVLVAFAYGSAAATLSSGDPTSGMLYAVGAVVMAQLLTNWRIAVLMVVYGTTIFALSAWSLHTGVELVPQTAVLPPVDMRLGHTGSLVIIGGLLIFSLSFLVARLSDSLGEHQRALVQLREAQGQLVNAGKMELLGQLAGGIAHDMNNALTVILAEAEFIGEEQPEESAAIVDAVNHASNLTRQMLSMGRRDIAQPRPLDLGKQVTRASSTLRRTLPREVRVQLELDPLGETVVVEADPNQLQQILLNLGTNAAHAMPEGGSLQLRVSLDGQGAALLEVADEGEGMDAQTLAQIFEPFFTTKPAERGTGLGLSSVRTIVSALGGTIECTSELGEGTCFSIRLPALAASALQAKEPDEQSPSDARLDGLRVLVIDEDVRVRAMVSICLQRVGATVIDRPSGEAAIRTAKREREPFDLLWTDALARGPQGSLAAWFSEHSPQTRILVCSTGPLEDEALERELSEGRYPLLSKPFSRGQVLEAVLRSP